MTSIAPGRQAGRLQGIVLLLPVTLAVMGVIVLVPVVPQMMAHFADVPGHEYLIQGGVLTMPALFMALSSPAGGWLADRFGRRRLLILAMVCYAIVGVAPAFIDNLMAIIATRIGVGIFEGIILTTTTILLCDYFGGAQRERWIAARTIGTVCDDMGDVGTIELPLSEIVPAKGMVASAVLTQSSGLSP